MQSSSPEASTSFLTILTSRALRSLELNGMCTGLNRATRAARSGTTTSLIAPLGDCCEPASVGCAENSEAAVTAASAMRPSDATTEVLIICRILSCETNEWEAQNGILGA